MIRWRHVVGVALLATLAAAGAASAGDDEKPFDNAEIIKLTKLDMGDAVIIAKIKSASAVEFATSTDDLIKLKEAGVTKSVIAAMLDRSSATTTTQGSTPSGAGYAAASSAADVTLQAAGGATRLKPIDGDVKTIVAPFVGMRRFVMFSELAASVRTKDRKPTVLISSGKDPRKTFWLVILDQDDDPEDMNRSLDVESPGMWGGVISSAPDSDMMVDYDATEEKPGVWRLTPRNELKPGEYGVYVGKGENTATLYDFGVDK